MRLAALLLTVILTGSADNERAMSMLNAWIDAVDRHAAGQQDPPFEIVAAWNVDDLEMMRAYIDALTGVPLDTPQRATRRRQISGNDLAVIKERAAAIQARGRLDDFRKRATMLHTDAALVAAVPMVSPPPKPRAQQSRRGEPEPIVDVMSADGRVDSFTFANPNWQIAMDVLETLPSKPQRDPIVARWYRAIGAHFAKEDNRADAVRHFERARKVVPGDPGVLFGEACLQETLGSPAVQNFARLAALPSGMVILGVSAPPTHFRRAENLLKRALAAEPDFVDARLRLGHVLAEQRQYEAALPHFAQVVAETREPLLSYYAHLFAGDAALALDRHAEARASYERALESHPRAQAARLGLAAALRAAGDRAAAVDALMITIAPTADDRDSRDDPWWQYYSGDAANVDRLLSDLRAPFAKPAK